MILPTQSSANCSTAVMTANTKNMVSGDIFCKSRCNSNIVIPIVLLKGLYIIFVSSSKHIQYTTDIYSVKYQLCTRLQTLNESYDSLATTPLGSKIKCRNLNMTEKFCCRPEQLYEILTQREVSRPAECYSKAQCRPEAKGKQSAGPFRHIATT